MSIEKEPSESPTDVSRNKSLRWRTLKSALAPGLNITNSTDFPVLFVLSQLSPLHWCRIEPGETKHVPCGRVLFTASAEVYDESTVPTAAGVAARIAGIVAATLLTGGLVGVGIVGTASAFTSFRPCHVHGIFADGGTLLVSSQMSEHNIPRLSITRLAQGESLHL